MRALKVLMILLFLFPVLVTGQGIDHEWVNTWGATSSGEIWGTGIGVDAAGNTYVSGIFTGTMDLDPGPSVSRIVCASSNAMFLAKYSPTGSFVWGGAIQSTLQSAALAMKVDASGNIYVAGDLFGIVDFDMGPGMDTLQGTGNDFFLAKYNTNGTIVWLKEMPTMNPINNWPDHEITDLHLDALGNTYLTGRIQVGMDFDPSGAAAISTPTGTQDAFLAKYDASGNHVLSFLLPSTSSYYSKGNGVTADASGNIYLVGQFSGTMDLDPGVGAVNVTALGSSDAFIAKYSPTGAYLWGFRQGVATSGTIAYDVALDAANNPVVVGGFLGAVDFDPSGVTYNMVGTAGRASVAKYSSAGAFTWARQYGSNNFVLPENIEIASNGDIFISTAYSNTGDFDPSGSTYNLTAVPGEMNIALARYTSTLGFVWAFGIPTSQGATEPKLALGLSSDVHITGRVAGTGDADPGAGTNVIGQTNLYSCPVAKYGNATGSHIWAFTTTCLGITQVQGNDEVRAVAVDASGNVLSGCNFQGSVDFDHGPGQALGLSIGVRDIAITKHDAAGQLLWAAVMGGTLDENIIDIGTDAAGNVFAVGYFQGTVDFDPSPAVFNLVSNGNNDIFLVKLSPSGSLLFAANIVSGLGQDDVRSIAIDATGQVFLCGYFSGSADFDPSPATVNLTAIGTTSGFLAKYSNAGAYLGAWALDAPSVVEALAKVRIDGAGKVWIAGYGSTSGSPIDLDPGPGVVNPASLGTNNAFVARYEPNGTLMSHFALTGTGASTTLVSLEFDPWGDLVLAGTYYGATDFDPGIGTSNLPLYVTNESFVAKISPSGTLRWANPVGGTNAQLLNVALPLGDGSIALVGYAYHEMDLDPGPAILPAGQLYGYDAFVIRVDSGGVYQGSMVIGSLGFELPYDAASSSGNAFVIAGFFANECDFDPGAGVDQHSSNGNRDAFLGKYSIQCAAPSLTLAGQSNVTCFGGSNGSASTNVSGGSGYTYTWSPSGGNAATATNLAAGNYQCIVTNQCGSRDTVSVTITQPSQLTSTQTVSVCNSYTWLVNGQTYTTSGPRTATLTSVAGCDSVITLNLTVRTNTSSTQTTSACNTYTWPVNGQTYTTSGVRTATIPNTAGCDSVITLNLTIRTNTASTQTTSTCNTYTWPVNGQTYTTSGVRTATIPNTAGCDSVITLNLTIGTNTSSTQTTSACNTYTWPVNGQTYTTSGVRTATIPNTAGCDSVITLNLTIGTNTASSQSTSACASYTWPVNGQTYTTSGPRTATIPNSAGCDSVITLNLTINQPTSATLTQSACNSFTLNGQTYTASGTYTQMLTNVAGCDSTLTITLTLNPVNATVTANGGTLSASPSGLSYQWLDCGNGHTPVSGATSASFTPASSGSYAVIVTDGACSDTSACEAVVGLAECGFCNGMVVFPNPFENRVTLQMSTVVLGLEMQLFDAHGKLILQMDVETLSKEIDMQNLARGVYWMRLRANGQQKVFPLTKQ